jgi:hypothetical protein
LACHYRIENHLTCHWSHYQVIDFVIANVIVLIQDFARRATLVAIQNVFAGTPQILMLNVQRSDDFRMTCIKLEKILSLLGYTLDGLTD